MKEASKHRDSCAQPSLFQPWQKQKVFLLLWLTTATYWLPYIIQNAGDSLGKTLGRYESARHRVKVLWLESDGFINGSHSLWWVPGYGPDRRRRTSWPLYLDLFFSILVTNAYHSIHHSQGQVLTVICPPSIEICIKNGDRVPDNWKQRLYLPTACYFAVHLMLVDRFLLWGPKSCK